MTTTARIAVEGALPETEIASTKPGIMLGIFHEGAIKCPEEIEPGFPTWFEAPRFARTAGLEFVKRHPETSGFDVTRVHHGRYRTVHTYWKPAKPDYTVAAIGAGGATCVIAEVTHVELAGK